MVRLSLSAPVFVPCVFWFLCCVPGSPLGWSYEASLSLNLAGLGVGELLFFMAPWLMREAGKNTFCKGTIQTGTKGGARKLDGWAVLDLSGRKRSLIWWG